MYGRKVKLRFLFIVIIFITLILTVFLVLKSLEDNVIYFQSPSEINSSVELNKSKISDEKLLFIKSVNLFFLFKK